MLLLAALQPTPVTADGEDVPDIEISIESPAAEAVVSSSFQVVGRVRVAGAKQAIVRVNGEDVTLVSGRFETTVTSASEGIFRIRIVAGVPGEPGTVVERPVTVDKTPPTLLVLEPQETVGVFPGGEGTIAGRVEDATQVRLWANERPVRLETNGDFELVFVLRRGEDLSVRLVARDPAGNETVVLRTLRAEVSAPTQPVPKSAGGKDAGLDASSPVKEPIADGPLDPVMDAGLRWLSAHQSRDGGWECEGFRRWCDRRPSLGEGPDGPGKAQYDVGVTGLALLALLKAGFTRTSSDPFGRSIRDACTYLMRSQDTEGCFGSRSTGHYTYNHAIAAQAMIEAYRADRGEALRRSAQRALDFISSARNPYFAWRYGIKPGDNDTSVTGWMLMALKSAMLLNAADVKAGKSASLRYDDEVFAGIKSWIEKMTDPDSGRVGYQQRGTGPARPSDLVDQFPADKSESMTAVAMVARIFLGENPATSRPLRDGATLCGRLRPRWDPGDGSIDMYYWYYGALAMSAVGGSDADEWVRTLANILRFAQRRDTDPCMYRGSWDPRDPWGVDGGRVYMTALALLAYLATDGAKSVTLDAASKNPSDPISKLSGEGAARVEWLKRRADEFALGRANLLGICGKCSGDGVSEGLKCDKCNGTGLVLLPGGFRKIYDSMRSPAYRASPKFAEMLEQERAALLKVPPAGIYAPRKWKIQDARLLGDRYGIVLIQGPDGTKPEETRWVWAESSGLTNWYLYSPVTDGIWPE